MAEERSPTHLLEQRLAELEREVQASREKTKAHEERLGQLTAENTELRKQIRTEDNGREDQTGWKKKLNFEDSEGEDTAEESDKDYTESEAKTTSEEEDGGSESDDSDMLRGRGRKRDKEAKKMKEEIRKLKEQVKRKADAKVAMVRESVVKCVDDPFVRWISNTRMPRKFMMPPIEKYSGKTDPEEHVMTYKYLMNTCNVPPEAYEAVLCRAFSASLAGAAQRWYASLSAGSIRSFASFMSKFINHFSHNKKVEIDEADLYDCKQKKSEALRKYLKRFNEMKVSVPDCKERVAIKAFIKGLIPDTKLQADLMSKTPRTFAEVRRKAEGAMIYKEDLAKKKGSDKREDVRKRTACRDFERKTRRSLIRREDVRRNPHRETRSTYARTAPYTR